ncbi:SMP-30/gluconolactonase/LRE family protein [Marinomonas balearica]|uniref:Sugar lactone lactonase YvrE n=1 Tax=Marinomonas balearica TaxID=491947 RepID=A0A4R6M3G3_9GAMM|nr:SMP-30/gluconolactonase/LRE family protein [Marinomonas balearica]TDO95817.1 sugar lactone lactonase YvrE [Marinomonas balearica]
MTTLENEISISPQITPISSERHTLAEGPFWCAETECLFWVDIPKQQVWRWSSQTQETRSWHMPKKVSAVFASQAPNLVVVLSDGVAIFDTETEIIEYLVTLDEDRPSNRTNDAKVAPDGSLWVGTMDDNEVQKSGRLWRVTPHGEKQKMLDNVGISNTLAWDESRDRFYFADSMAGEIHQFPYPNFTDTRNHSPFAKVEIGAPDGSAIDADGCLWNAQWDGQKVVKYSPAGNVLMTVQLPFARPTSCAFGGKNGNTLFITSASVGLTDKQLAQSPLSGHVVAIEVDASGSAGAPFQISDY